MLQVKQQGTEPEVGELTARVDSTLWPHSEWIRMRYEQDSLIIIIWILVTSHMDPDDGVRDSLWSVGSERSTDAADSSGEFYIIHLPWKFQVL
jgi:hypothetical protein